MNNLSQYSKIIVFYILSVAIVIWPAIYNGYPLVYSDTGTYITSSIDLITPMDRPLFYGFFVRMTAMQERNWIPIIVQGLIAVWLIKQTIVHFFKHHIYIISFSVIALLGILTGLPWYASQLMPDIFTSYGGLCIFLLLFKVDLKKYEKILLLLILLLSVGAHLSNFFIYSFSLFILVLVQIKSIWLNKKQSIINYGSIVGIFLLSLLMHASINYKQHGVFTLSRGSDLFLAAKCLETPLLKTYMRDNPHNIKIPFMNQIDSIPNSACGFLWDGNSPVNSSGINRIELNKMYTPVMKDLLSISKYRWLFIKEMFNSSFTQMKYSRVGSGLISYQEESSPYWAIRDHFSKDLKYFMNAKQFKMSLENNYHLHISVMIFYGSLLLMLFGILYKTTRKHYLTFIIFIISFVYFNAFITAGLANVYDRLQVRVVWLLTFTAIMIIITSYQSIVNKKSMPIN